MRASRICYVVWVFHPGRRLALRLRHPALGHQDDRIPYGQRVSQRELSKGEEANLGGVDRTRAKRRGSDARPENVDARQRTSVSEVVGGVSGTSFATGWGWASYFPAFGCQF